MSDQLETGELDGQPAGEQDDQEQYEAEEAESGLESEQESDQDAGEDEAGKASGYVEINDPKIRERVGQLTREKWEERRKREDLEKRLKELEEKTKPALKEVKAPDPDLAIDDPKEFARQQQAHADYIRQSEARRIEEEQTREQAKVQHQQELRQRVETYTDRAKKLKIDMSKLQSAAAEIQRVGVSDDVVNYILDDPDGPAITAHLGSSLDDLLAVAQGTPLQAVAHIERMRTKLARKSKTSAPPPPTKVFGTRSAGSKAQDGTIYE